MYGSSDLKIGGVYLPGDIIPKDDEKALNKHLEIDNNASNILNTDGTQPETYVAATEEVNEAPSPEPVEMKNSPIEDQSVDNESDGNFVYACNICGVQYAVKEDCERHLQVHTG